MDWIAAAEITANPFLGFTGGLISYLIISISLFVIAKNEGEQYAWFAFVPILNVLLVLNIAGMSGWWILAMLVPIVNFFVAIYVLLEFAGAIGRPKWYGLLFAIPCVNFIAWPLAAFSKK